MVEPVYRTALITGASSGLGAEFARQLASQGVNLVLVARRLDRLENLAQELQARHGIQAEVLQADLSTEPGLAAVERRIACLPELDLLVNNAGYGLRGKFHANPIQKHLDSIHTQVIASVCLARAALEGMVQRNRGALINVSSVAAFVPIRNATYTAMKAYLLNFSEALQSELWGSSIKVQALCPGFVHTEFHDTKELAGFKRSSIPGILWLKADDVVRASLKALNGNQVVFVPSWQYQFIVTFARLPLTSDIVRLVARWLMRRRHAY
jgi:short-subunit dehydrogenase